MMEQLRVQLASDGVATVPRVLDEEFLAPVRAAVAALLRESQSADVLRSDAGTVRKLTYPLAMDRRFLVALAHPKLLELALAISPAPEQLVLTWEDILHKAPLTGEAVPVHQDLALQSLPGPVFSLGVHLDDATDNPIWFLRGSHRLGPQSAEEVRALRARGGFTAVAPLAGDVVIHDVLCVHYSERNTVSKPRNTWYLEFRTLHQLAADGRWPRSWAHQRRALLFHACAARHEQGLPTAWPPLGPGETLEGWLQEPPVLRVPHVSHGVDYDVTSPWYHFA